MSRNAKNAHRARESRQRGSRPQRVEHQKIVAGNRQGRRLAKKPKKRSVLRRLLKRFRILLLRLNKKIAPEKAYTGFLIIGCILTVAVGSLGVYSLINKNAVAIYVGQTQAAIIKKTKEDIAGEIEKQAIFKIENHLGTSILINEEIMFTPIRASKKEISGTDDAIQKVSQLLTFKIEAILLSVEGTQMAILKNQNEADQLLDAIKAPYFQNGVEIIESGFVEDVKTEKAFILEEQLTTTEDALRMLTSTMETRETYTVQSGDSLGIIASKYGMTLTQIYDINPNINSGTVLHVGDVINLTVEKPLLSVRTVEERRYIDVEPKPLQTILNNNERATYRKTLQYGTVGQAEVVQHVIRINGMESETIDVDRVITLEPTPEVIEVGTK